MKTHAAWMVALLFGSVLYSSATRKEDSSDPDVIVPESSLSLPQDVGVRAHTNHLIYVGPPNPRGQEIDPIDFATHGPVANSLAFSIPGYHPADIRAAYDLPATGGSDAIAVVDAYHYATSLGDFNTFAEQFGLPVESSTTATAASNKVFEVVYQGTTKPTTNPDWSAEASLDIEWTHALAPGAKIYLVEANSSAFSDLFAAVNKAATLPGVRQISMSWGGAEFSSEASYDITFSHQGITFYGAAGDTAAEKSYPALSPNVVGVGGTTLKLSTSDKVLSETAWSNTGGGVSAHEPIPIYQKPISAIVGKFKGSPDVSFNADPKTGVAVYDSTKLNGQVGWMVFGGTSVATPCVAGVANLSGHNLSNTIAELERVYSELGKSSFRDIVSGAAGPNKAKAGWDFCTGVGSPVGIEGM